MGKYDPTGAFATVSIARNQRTAVRVHFGNNVHHIGVSPLTEYQLPVAGQRQATRASRMVAQLDHRELHRCVHRHVGIQFRGNTGLVMFEHAVAESVPAHIAGITARR